MRKYLLALLVPLAACGGGRDPLAQARFDAAMHDRYGYSSETSHKVAEAVCARTPHWFDDFDPGRAQLPPAEMDPITFTILTANDTICPGLLKGS